MASKRFIVYDDDEDAVAPPTTAPRYIVYDDDETGPAGAGSGAGAGAALLSPSFASPSYASRDMPAAPAPSYASRDPSVASAAPSYASRGMPAAPAPSYASVDMPAASAAPSAVSNSLGEGVEFSSGGDGGYDDAPDDGFELSSGFDMDHGRPEVVLPVGPRETIPTPGRTTADYPFYHLHPWGAPLVATRYAVPDEDVRHGMVWPLAPSRPAEMAAVAAATNRANARADAEGLWPAMPVRPATPTTWDQPLWGADSPGSLGMSGAGSSSRGFAGVDSLSGLPDLPDPSDFAGAGDDDYGGLTFDDVDFTQGGMESGRDFADGAYTFGTEDAAE
jgi:hypothetical protein